MNTNEQTEKDMNGDIQKVQVIAEMAWAHDGSIDKAIGIMNEAKKAGADAFGIHITDLPTYIVPHYGSGEGRVSAGKEHLEVYSYLESINPSGDDWIRLAGEAESISIDLCVMPNDFNSLAFCEEYIKPKYYVLAAAAFVEPGFIEAVARCGRATVFRIGGATLGEVESAVHRFKAISDAPVILLHGFQNYPTAIEETNIRQIEQLKKIFNVEVGLADHIDGGDPVAKVIPLLALGFGATYIEKHITWNRDEKGEDFEAALNPSDFAEFIRYLRASELALGGSEWKPLTSAAERYRGITRKRAVAARKIPAGTVLSEGDIVFKRSDVGLAGDRLSSLLGRKVAADLLENEGIEEESLL